MGHVEPRQDQAMQTLSEDAAQKALRAAAQKMDYGKWLCIAGIINIVLHLDAFVIALSMFQMVFGTVMYCHFRGLVQAGRGWRQG